MRKNRLWSHVGTTGERPKLWAAAIADDGSLIWNSVLLDDFSECTREARKIEDAKLGRALKAKKEKEARGVLGTAETPAQKTKKAADNAKKEKAKAKQLEDDESGAVNSSTSAAVQTLGTEQRCSVYDGCMIKGCTLKHREKCRDCHTCKIENCKFAHRWQRGKNNNLPVITAATEPAKRPPSGADFVNHNGPSYISQYVCYPAKEGEWKIFKLTVCPKCLCNTASTP